MDEGSDLLTNPAGADTTALSFLGSHGFHEFVRYFLASAVALLVDAGLLWLLTSIFAVPYLISGAIAFTAGLVIVYVLSITWVFEARTLRDPVVEFVTFALIGIAGLLLNEIILWFFTSLVGLYYFFSKAISVIFVFSWNFAVRRLLLFRKRA